MLTATLTRSVNASTAEQHRVCIPVLLLLPVIIDINAVAQLPRILTGLGGWLTFVCASIPAGTADILQGCFALWTLKLSTIQWK